jgi:hypothetical protein
MILKVTGNPQKRDFWDLGDRCPKDGQRCGFQLHPGSRSEGCITIDKDDQNAMYQYDIIQGVLRQDKHNQLFVIP